MNTKYPIQISVFLDGQEWIYDVPASTKPQKVIVEKCGEQVGFEIFSDEQNLLVAPMVAVVDIMRQ